MEFRFSYIVICSNLQFYYFGRGIFKVVCFICVVCWNWLIKRWWFNNILALCIFCLFSLSIELRIRLSIRRKSYKKFQIFLRILWASFHVLGRHYYNGLNSKQTKTIQMCKGCLIKHNIISITVKDKRLRYQKKALLATFGRDQGMKNIAENSLIQTEKYIFSCT